MSLHKIRVRHADVFPDENNPRRDMGGLEALAASFDANTDHPGEPFTPPLLATDGAVYRIVDGERRWRAMALAGTKEFTALAADGMDDAEAMLAMLATDDKQPLTPLEKSRGVQLAILGLDSPTDSQLALVAKASRIDALDAYRVARARMAVDDAGEDMTLERLYAVAEFDEAGDEEAVKAVSTAEEGKWERVAEVCRRRADYAKRVAQFQSWCATRGIPCGLAGTFYQGVDGLMRHAFYTVEEVGEGEYVQALVYGGDTDTSWSAPVLLLYTKNAGSAAAERAETEEERAEKETIERLQAFDRRDRKRREEFARAHLTGCLPSLTPTMRWLLTDTNEGEDKEFQDFLDNVDFFPMLVSNAVKGEVGEYELLAYRRYTGMLEALVSDGYELSDDEEELRDMALALLAEALGDGDEYEDPDDGDDDWEEDDDDE